jgi:hypothetical protein
MNVVSLLFTVIRRSRLRCQNSFGDGAEVKGKGTLMGKDGIDIRMIRHRHS